MKNLTSSLKTKISIEKSIKTPDNAGGFDISWEYYKNCYCKIENLGTQQYQFNNININRATYKIIMRYDPDITIENRININGEIFIIKSIFNIEKNRLPMEIICVQDL